MTKTMSDCSATALGESTTVAPLAFCWFVGRIEKEGVRVRRGLWLMIRRACVQPRVDQVSIEPSKTTAYQGIALGEGAAIDGGLEAGVD